MSELLLPLARMSRKLGVTQQWLRREAEAGRVPHLRAGHRYLFDPGTVEVVLARRASQAPEGPTHA